MSNITNGDNGIPGLTRPAPFGISLDNPVAFYWFVLIVAVVAFLMMAIFVSSAFGSSLKGVRDQPRRMAALGFNPWLVRWITFVYAGFWGGVSGLLYVYYHKYIHPTSLSTTSSAEALLGVIAGGSGTWPGCRRSARAVIEELCLRVCRTVEYVVGLGVPAYRAGNAQRHRSRREQPGCEIAWGVSVTATASNHALEVVNLRKAFGGLAVTQDVSISVRPGERRLIIGPNGAGKTTLFNQISGDLRPNSGLIRLFGSEITYLPPYKRAHFGLSRTYQIITLFAGDTLQHNVTLGLLGLHAARWQMWRPMSFYSALAAEARKTLDAVGLLHLATHPISDIAYGEKRRVELAVALAQKPRVLLLDEPLAGLSDMERATVKALIAAIPRETTVIMIEHDMDTALDLAETVTLLNYGRVIVDGERDAVIGDERTREVYLGT
jgi:branched-chain amino acid transport system ATP-binding protein